ncbi:MAG TPA: DUF4282 domain-containing protein [Caulobacteraceae bacterium]|jgi:hypothetical protein
MGPARGAAPRRSRGIFSILTFETMITGPVIHLVYWAGLGVIVVAAFGVIGASLGVGLRAVMERSWETLLVVIPGFIGGLLIVIAGGLLWRAFCEFYVVIFRIGDDLAALRRAAEAEQSRTQIPH